MKCSSCGQQKKDLSAKPSALIGGMRLFMCNTCIEKGYEPRYLVILYMRSHREGAGKKNKAKKYIADRLYVGEEIKASEIVID